MYRYVYRVICVAGLLLVATTAVCAQSSGLTEDFRQIHLVHVSPHLIVLTPTHSTATLEFRNESDEPSQANVQIELGYTVWPARDTALTLRHWQDGTPRDSVIMNPVPKDHYAGQWLSGVPTYLALRPHETRQITLQIHPPKDIPTGEYYARIVVVAERKHGKEKPSDSKLDYKLPVKGNTPQPLRDSVRVFYRQGPQSMGLRIVRAEAHVDTSHVGVTGINGDSGWHPLRVLVQWHLTGTAHFAGYETLAIRGTDGEEYPIESANGSMFTIHRDGIEHLYMNVPATPGHYVLVYRLIPDDSEFPEAQQTAMPPVEHLIPFDVP